MTKNTQKAVKIYKIIGILLAALAGGILGYIAFGLYIAALGVTLGSMLGFFLGNITCPEYADISFKENETTLL